MGRTPTVVHFTTVMFLAALLSAPCSEITTPATVWGCVGAAGILFSARIILHVRRQDSYQPVLEDWLFHVVLPVLSYMNLLMAAVFAPIHLRGSLFGVGGTMLLLFIGIHNTWDTVAYHVFTEGEKRLQEEFPKAG